MQRFPLTPRQDWERIVESQGFTFHTAGDGDTPYWDESAYYGFSAKEIDVLEAASYALNDMCLKAVEHVVTRNLFEPFGIPPAYQPLVKTSWERDEYTVYGRFDLVYDGTNPPKLLEYNADTPTALLEAAVVQWYWLKDCFPARDQFNSIHERLLEIWSALKEKTRGGKWYFSALGGHVEDYMTVNYLRDTAIQAGLETEYLNIEQVGWDSRLRAFVDKAGRPLHYVFKLYPWEWILHEQFGPHLLESATRWLEAPWKMLLSNKAILPILWELFPESPFLLRAAWEPLATSYVKKPIFGREGANISLVVDGVVQAETEGVYGKNPCIYQELHSPPNLDGNYPVIGSWMVNGYACGIGIREDTALITQNISRFVPHLIL